MLHVSSITFSTSGGTAQTTLDILRACQLVVPALEFYLIILNKLNKKCITLFLIYREDGGV
jgi:hypothetical protein